jgi:hypothetical protein
LAGQIGSVGADDPAAVAFGASLRCVEAPGACIAARQHGWAGLSAAPCCCIGFVGAYDVRPVVSINANPSAPGAGTASGVLSQKYGANYTGGIGELLPFKDSRYDALQTSLKYGFAGGSNLNVVYTWSKTMSYADDQELNPGGFFISYAPDYFKNYGPSLFDRTNNFEVSAVVAG